MQVTYPFNLTIIVMSRTCVEKAWNRFSPRFRGVSYRFLQPSRSSCLSTKRPRSVPEATKKRLADRSRPCTNQRTRRCPQKYRHGHGARTRMHRAAMSLECQNGNRWKSRASDTTQRRATRQGPSERRALHSFSRCHSTDSIWD